MELEGSSGIRHCPFPTKTPLLDSSSRFTQIWVCRAKVSLRTKAADVKDRTASIAKRRAELNYDHAKLPKLAIADTKMGPPKWLEFSEKYITERMANTMPVQDNHMWAMVCRSPSQPFAAQEQCLCSI